MLVYFGHLRENILYQNSVKPHENSGISFNSRDIRGSLRRQIHLSRSPRFQSKCHWDADTWNKMQTKLKEISNLCH